MSKCEIKVALDELWELWGQTNNELIKDILESAISDLVRRLYNE